MKRTIILLLILALVILPLIAQKPTPTINKIHIPPYKLFTLDNGLKVIIMEYHRLPLIEMQMTFGGGTSVDPDTLVGLAGITATLLRQVRQCVRRHRLLSK